MKKNSNNKKEVDVKPLFDKVLIKPFLEDEMKKTDLGIIIPETVDRDKPEQGEVIAVGEGRYEDGKIIPVSVKVGDRVVFSKYGYDEIKIEDEEFYILKEDSLLAIIK